MKTINDAPRAFAVMRETASGGRIKVGLYPTIEEAAKAIIRSERRNAVAPLDDVEAAEGQAPAFVPRHAVWEASWSLIDIPADIMAEAKADMEQDAMPDMGPDDFADQLDADAIIAAQP